MSCSGCKARRRWNLRCGYRSRFTLPARSTTRSSAEPGAIQTAFPRNLQLRKTRENLRLSERTLTHPLGEIQDLQARLQEQASRDPLTGLYNRRFLDTIVGREISRCHRDHQYMVVMLIDLDHFKNVNDTYGHQAGDEVLKTLSALLLENARAADVPCRYGGEEFISIGVALYPTHGETVAALTRSADLALYRAKAEGRNRVVMYQRELEAPRP